MAGRKTMRHSEEWWQIVAPTTAVRCEAHTQDGNRCRREAIAGANVCRQHGGAIPAVKAKAAARIGNAAEEMVKRLHAMLDDPQVGATEKMKIAQDMLDRAGLNAANKLLVGVGEVDPVERLFRDLLADPDGLGPSAPPSPSLPALSRPLDDGESSPLHNWEHHDIVDGEVVEEDLIGPYGAPPSESAPMPSRIREDLGRGDGQGLGHRAHRE